MWKNCKAKFKAMNGVCTTTLVSYLDKFIWHLIYNIDPFNALLLHLAMWYPAQ